MERFNIIARDTFHISARCELCPAAPGTLVRAQDQSPVPGGVSAAAIAPVSRERSPGRQPIDCEARRDRYII